MYAPYRTKRVGDWPVWVYLCCKCWMGKLVGVYVCMNVGVAWMWVCTFACGGMCVVCVH